MATQEQIDSFHRFATEQLANGGREKTVDELYDQWRFENQTAEEFEENVAAIQGAIDDMNNGDTGRDADEVIAEIRARYNLPAAERHSRSECSGERTLTSQTSSPTFTNGRRRERPRG